MDGDVGLMIERSPREKKRSYKDVLIDVDELEKRGSDVEEHSSKRPYKLFQESKCLDKKKLQHFGSSRTGAEIFEVDSADYLPVYPICVSQDRWSEQDEEENIQDNLLVSGCTAEGSIDQISPDPMLEPWVSFGDQHVMADCPFTRPGTLSASPLTHSPLVAAIAGTVVSNTNPLTHMTTSTSSMNTPSISVWDSLRSRSRGPVCSNLDPVSAAAHLHLLGESLSLIGHQLQETHKTVCVSSSLSLLLDSLLCALAPLVSLTSQIPELRSCTHTLAATLENIAYVMPGL
ncbi:hypothetical protein LDENG_00032590 [Lucifuga dentata]|nr:hypothetical protein LDENG_00032590 [Lucifuga dentata]